VARRSASANTKLADASRAYQAALETVRSAELWLPDPQVEELRDDLQRAKVELDRAWMLEHGIEWL
jgi:multidrug resistance efflux pump